MGGTGDVSLEPVTGDNVYVETTTGSQKLVKIEAEQLYVARTGNVNGRELHGQHRVSDAKRLSRHCRKHGLRERSHRHGQHPRAHATSGSSRTRR